MIDRILEFSLRQRATVLLAAVALLGAGLWSALHLPVDAVPDITGVQVQVNAEVAALAAEESEKLVTQPIERELAGLPGVEEMRSITKFGLSQVTLQFKDGTDIYRARQLVVGFGYLLATGLLQPERHQRQQPELGRTREAEQHRAKDRAAKGESAQRQRRRRQIEA